MKCLALLRNPADKIFRVKVTVARSKVKVRQNVTLAQPLMKMSLYTEYEMPSSSGCWEITQTSIFRVKVTVARSKVKVRRNVTSAHTLMKMSLYNEYEMPSSSRCWEIALTRCPSTERRTDGRTFVNTISPAWSPTAMAGRLVHRPYIFVSSIGKFFRSILEHYRSFPRLVWRDHSTKIYVRSHYGDPTRRLMGIFLCV
jgi:hypothetical protein